MGKTVVTQLESSYKQSDCGKLYVR